MSTTVHAMNLVKEARDLQEFFLGTYVEKVIEDAIKSNNADLIQITVNEFNNKRQLIEDAEDERAY